MIIFQAVVWDNGEIHSHIFIKVNQASHFVEREVISPLLLLGEWCSFETSLCCLRLVLLLVNG